MNEYLTERQKRVLLIIIVIGFLLTMAVALTDTQPAGAQTETPDACWKWRKTCTVYRYFFGVRICYVWRLTCIGTAPAARVDGLAAPAPDWDRSSIVVDGRCLSDGTAQFTVTNTGQAMDGPSTWRLFREDALIEEGAFQLLSGATEVFEYGPAWNIEIRFEADQRPGHPGASAPRLTLTCQQPTAIRLSTFSVRSAGNRGGCNPESRAIGLACVVRDAGVGWVSGTCQFGEYFLAQTLRTFRPGQSVTVSGCVDEHGALFGAPGAPLRISR